MARTLSMGACIRPLPGEALIAGARVTWGNPVKSPKGIDTVAGGNAPGTQTPKMD